MCRFTGTAWNCPRTSSDASTVTRVGATQPSPWAVSDGATPVTLRRFRFRMPIAGSVGALYAVGLVFIAAVLGLGTLLSTLAKTQLQAMQMSFMFLLPFVFLSGYVFPIEGMPGIFQLLSRIIPARYFIEVLRGIILRGASLVELAEPVAWLTLYTVLIIGLAVARFKKTAE